jgi:hypothetical protein
VAYLRVSTKSQKLDGLGMGNQEQGVADLVARQGGGLIGVLREVEPGANTDQERPALSQAWRWPRK